MIVYDAEFLFALAMAVPRAQWNEMARFVPTGLLARLTGSATYDNCLGVYRTAMGLAFPR